MKKVKKLFAFFVIGVLAMLYAVTSVSAQELGTIPGTRLQTQINYQNPVRRNLNNVTVEPFTIYVYVYASAGAGGSISPEGTKKVYSGGSATFSMVPHAGYSIDAVTVNNVPVTNYTVDGTGVGKITLSNIKADMTLQVTFKQAQLSIVATVSGKGSISPSGTTNLSGGGNQTYVMTPEKGYKIDKVQIGGVDTQDYTIDKSGVGTYTFYNLQAATSILVVYKPASYTIQASYIGSKAGGSINPAAGSSTVQGGESKAYTFVAAAGYRIKQVQVDGASVGALSGYTFSNVTADHVISVEFEMLPPAGASSSASSASKASAGSSGANSKSGSTSGSKSDIPSSSSALSQSSVSDAGSEESHSAGSGGAESMVNNMQGDVNSIVSRPEDATRTETNEGVPVAVDEPVIANFTESNWAWVNILLAFIALAAAVLVGVNISRESKNTEDSSRYYTPAQEKYRLAAYVAIFSLALFSVLTLLVLESFKGAMSAFNRLTPLMALYFVLQLLCFLGLVFIEKNKKEKQKILPDALSETGQSENRESQKAKNIYRASQEPLQDTEPEPAAAFYVNREKGKTQKKEEEFFVEEPYGAEAGARFFKEEGAEDETEAKTIQEQPEEESPQDTQLTTNEGGTEDAALESIDLPLSAEPDMEELSRKDYHFGRKTTVEETQVLENDVPKAEMVSVPDLPLQEYENVPDDDRNQQNYVLEEMYTEKERSEILTDFPVKELLYFDRMHADNKAGEVVEVQDSKEGQLPAVVFIIKEESPSAAVPYIVNGVLNGEDGFYSPQVDTSVPANMNEDIQTGYAYNNWDKNNRRDILQVHSYLACTEVLEDRTVVNETVEGEAEEKEAIEDTVEGNETADKEAEETVLEVNETEEREPEESEPEESIPEKDEAGENEPGGQKAGRKILFTPLALNKKQNLPNADILPLDREAEEEETEQPAVGKAVKSLPEENTYFDTYYGNTELIHLFDVLADKKDTGAVPEEELPQQELQEPSEDREV